MKKVGRAGGTERQVTGKVRRRTGEITSAQVSEIAAGIAAADPNGGLRLASAIVRCVAVRLDVSPESATALFNAASSISDVRSHTASIARDDAARVCGFAISGPIGRIGCVFPAGHRGAHATAEVVDSLDADAGFQRDLADPEGLRTRVELVNPADAARLSTAVDNEPAAEKREPLPAQPSAGRVIRALADARTPDEIEELIAIARAWVAPASEVDLDSSGREMSSIDTLVHNAAFGPEDFGGSDYPHDLPQPLVDEQARTR